MQGSSRDNSHTNRVLKNHPENALLLKKMCIEVKCFR